MTVIQHVRMKRNHMATTFDFVVSLPADHAPIHGQLARLATLALTRAHERVARLEDELSEYREGSPVRALNLATPFEKIRMPASMRELLVRAERIRTLSRGLFDCTIKGAVGQVAWDHTHAWRTHPKAHLGFGAIGKGYALDCARAEIEADGFGDYLLSGGGSSVVLAGFAAPGDPWNFGWSWKRDTHGEDLGFALSHASGYPIALGISGTHEKGEHIIVPTLTAGPNLSIQDFSQKPRRLSPASSLVGAASATDADAWSTALFVAGFDAGVELMAEAQLGPSPAVAQIDADGTPRWNGIFQQLWGVPA